MPGRHATGVTAVGCLKREADVPGIQRSMLERWGVVHDFVLTDVRMATTPGTSTPTSANPSSKDEKASEVLDKVKSVPESDAVYYVAGLGTGAMEPLANHLVALDGQVRDDRVGVSRGLEDTDTVTSETASHFEANGRTASTGMLKTDTNTAHDRSKKPAGSAVRDLPMLQATSIRGVAPTCDASS